MISKLYWIEHNGKLPPLAIMARPRSGDWLEDEIRALRNAGVGTVVSLLENSEVTELGLEEEGRLCVENGIDFLSFPIADRGVPDKADEVISLCRSLGTSGKPVAIHCRAGIGRSALVAATMLVLAGMTADAAIAAIGEARGLSVPDTDAQSDWIRQVRDPRET